jgi:hypothetical protein
MKAYFLWTVAGPKLILTSYDYIQHPEFLKRLADTGIDKFEAHEIPLDLVKERCGEHYQVVLNGPEQTDELRMVDISASRILVNFSFKELVPPIYYEAEQEKIIS